MSVSTLYAGVRLTDPSRSASLFLQDLTDRPYGLVNGDYGFFGDTVFRYSRAVDTWLPPDIFDRSPSLVAKAEGTESALELAASGWQVNTRGGGLLASKGGFLELLAPAVESGNSLALIGAGSGEVYFQGEYYALASYDSAWGLSVIQPDSFLPPWSFPRSYVYFLDDGSWISQADSGIPSPKLSWVSSTGIFSAGALGNTRNGAKLYLRSLRIISYD